MQQAFVSTERLASLGWFPDGPPVPKSDHVLQGFRQRGSREVMYGKLPLAATNDQGKKSPQSQES